MARHRCCASSRYTGKIRNVLGDSSICNLIFYVCLHFFASAEAGLYTPSDQIVILNRNNVDSVFNSSTALVVEFYASWCGHCVEFSPVWKSLAMDIKEWKPAVDLAAIDCAADENRATCSHFGIRGYPSLKFFQAYSQSGSKGVSMSASKRKVSWLRHQIVEMMGSHKDSWPPACPPLETASTVEIDSFFETSSPEHLALVFEKDDSYVGREVILDMLQFEKIAVRRVLNTEEDLVSRLGVTDFPSCYLYYRNGNFTRLKVHIEARAFYSYALQRLPGVVRSGRPQPVAPELWPEATDQQWRTFNRSRVYMADLESALHYSLRLELEAHPFISGKDLTALKRYISVLAKYFPGRSVVKNLLLSVDAWLKEQGDSPLPYSSLRRVLDNAARAPDAVLPATVRWVGCQGSQPHLRGYPCSMWTLFHVLTVQAKDKSSSAPADPQEVLQAMRAYVGSFFGCRSCATHFENMARDSMGKSRTPSAAVLWLWSRHNVVNNRLAGALSEDPKFPKIQWPSPDLCPQCHGVEITGEHSWNRTSVLAFLMGYFSSDNIMHDYLDNEAQLLKKASEERDALRGEQEAEQEPKEEPKGGATGKAEEEQGAPEEPEPEGEEEMEQDQEPTQDGIVEGKLGGENRTSAPRSWDEHETVEMVPQHRASIVGLKLREPQEDIVDLDSFVNQQYKAKAVRAKGAVRRRREQPHQGVGLQPVEPGDYAGVKRRLQKRGLTGKYTGLEEEERLEIADMDLPSHGKPWIWVLSVGFSRLDLSLCVLLYMMSSMCLLAMYLYFKLRFRLRRTKVALL